MNRMSEKGKTLRTVDAARTPSCPPLLIAVITLGFGLFRGVNANSYLSAFSSVETAFLFVPDIFFNIVVGVAVIVTSGSVVALAAKGRLRPLSMPYLAPAAMLALCNIAVMLGAFNALPADLALLVPGLVSGAAGVMLSLSWLEVLAFQRPSAIVVQIALSMLINVVISSTLSNQPAQVRALMTCLLLVAMVLCMRHVRLRLPQVLGSGAVFPVERPPRRQYRSALLELGDSLAAFFVLEAVIGVLNSFMLAGRFTFAGSGSVSSLAMVVAVVTFSAVVFVAQRIPRASTAFRVIAPAIAALLVFMPFLGEMYNLFFSTVLLGGYYFVALLITYLVAEVAHERRVSPYVLMGVASGIARVCLVAALAVGYSLGSVQGGLFGESEHTMRFLVIVVAVIYVLSMALVFISRDRWRRKGVAGDEVALASDAAPASAGYAAQVSAGGDARGDGAEAAGVVLVETVDPVEERCASVAARGGLTEREAEILGYLARGRTNAHIAGVLYVSENTVRSHVRNIYSKLGVHTRQQLIDLVEAEADADASVAVDSG